MIFPWILSLLWLFPSRVSTKLQPVAECFTGWDVRQAQECCDVSLAPRGNENCWDSTFTFERCCSENFNFDLRYCCGSSLKCLNFSFDCARGRKCHIQPGFASLSREISAVRNGTCDDGYPLWPPRYIAVDHKEGELEDGHRVSLKGTIYLTGKMMRLFGEALPGQRALFQQRSMDPCFGSFSQKENVFGTCWRTHGQQDSLSANIARPLRYLDCSSCKLPQCKIYSLDFSLRSDINTHFQEGLVLAVPRACTHKDVVFRLLPYIVAQRRPKHAFFVRDVTLRHFVPGDDCQNDGQPSVWPALAVCLPIMLLPRLCKFIFPQKHSERRTRRSLDAVDFMRAVAIWRTCTYHFEVAFPFGDFITFMHESLGPNDPALGELLSSRFQTCMEGLYSIISLFLVFQCDTFQMFCKRLMRKVVRQFLPNICIFMCQPVLQFSSSPMNCVRGAHWTWGKTSGREGIMRALHIHPAPDPFFTWAMVLDMKQFLALGVLGVLRFRLPWVSQACCVLCWAHLIGLSQQQRASVSLMKATGAADICGIDMHYSFWLNWFPTGVVLLNVDTFFRSQNTVHMMVRVKQTFGRFLLSFVMLLLVASFWIGNPIFKSDWKQLGFQDCGSHPKTTGIPYVLSCLPFHVAAFVSLHLAASSCEQWEPVKPRFCDGFFQLQSLILETVAPVCHALRDVGLAFQVWHQQVRHLLHAHQPSWYGLWLSVLEAQPGETRWVATLWTQLLFFLPMVFSAFVFAWFTYHLIEKPSAWLLRLFSEACPTPLLYALAIAYFIFCNIFWWL